MSPAESKVRVDSTLQKTAGVSELLRREGSQNRCEMIETLLKRGAHRQVGPLA